MISFKINSLSETIKLGLPLFEKHWKEVSLHQDVRPLNINYEMYFKVEADGKLACIGIYKDDVFVGYAMFTMTQHHNYKQDMVASNINLFMDPSARIGRKPFDDLAKFCEDHFRSVGMTVINFHVKPTRDFSPLLKKKGYEEEDTIYAKRLN